MNRAGLAASPGSQKMNFPSRSPIDGKTHLTRLQLPPCVKWPCAPPWCWVAVKTASFPVLRRLTRLGLGGRMGNGRQFVSWIHQLDFCRAVEWLLTHEELGGPVNLTAPNPVTNAEMMKIFREIFTVPIGLPATKWMLEFGTFVLRTESELVIKSRRVIPGRLLVSGFRFQFQNLRLAVEDLKNV